MKIHTKNRIDRAHKDFIQKRIGKTRFGKKTKAATDDQTVQHLREMIKRHGAGVLTPTERRLLQELTGRKIDKPIRHLGGHKAKPLIANAR